MQLRNALLKPDTPADDAERRWFVEFLLEGSGFELPVLLGLEHI